MKNILTIIFFLFCNYCNSQTNGFNYNSIATPHYSNNKQINWNDSVIIYHPFYFDTTVYCKLYKNGHLEIFDSSKNIIESGLLNFTCSNRCSRFNLWNEYYKTGELKACGYYKKDQKINNWKYFYKNGNLMRFEDYPYDNDYKFSFDNPYFQSEPFLISEYEYYENGQLKMEGTYERSNDCKGLDSIYMTDPKTGKETLQIQPIESCSKKCGTWNYYFPDGSLMKREEY